MFNSKLHAEIAKIKNELSIINGQLHVMKTKEPILEYIEELKHLNANCDKNMFRLEQMMQQLREIAHTIKPEKNYTSVCF